MVTIPMLVGKTLRHAASELEDLGLTAEHDGGSEFGETFADGLSYLCPGSPQPIATTDRMHREVTAVMPEEGSSVEVNTTVTLTSKIVRVFAEVPAPGCIPI